MKHRFFSTTPLDTGQLTLSGAEAHHLLHVLRLGVGQQVVLFDGGGSEFLASIARVGRSDAELHIDERRDVDRELSCAITLAVALPKGERQRWLVEKSVEMGAASLVPLITTRGVAQPTDKALERLRRAVVEACKQCGRNRLTDISEPQPWDAFLRTVDANTLRLLAHPGGDHAIGEILPKASATSHVAVAIGPEGGFTDSEISGATQIGWHTVDLGPRILRIETAAVALAAAIALLTTGTEPKDVL